MKTSETDFSERAEDSQSQTDVDRIIGAINDVQEAMSARAGHALEIDRIEAVLGHRETTVRIFWRRKPQQSIN